MSAVIDLTCDLIRRQSVTPEDGGCQQLIASRLAAMGFHIDHLKFGNVENLWAVRGDEREIFCFAGHTDVVPTGDVLAWTSRPFEPTIRDGYLFGRGAADMKSALAAMVVACERFLFEYPDHRGAIAFLITSDEEGAATHGTLKVIEHLAARKQKIKWCLVGEPSSTAVVGDTIKVGRRGSLNGVLTIMGKQGHIAYPHLAENPIHTAAPVLNALISIQWDKGNEFFQPSSFQISNISAGTGASNVIPGDIEIVFNIRFSPELSPKIIQDRIQQLLDRLQVKYELRWTLSGMPFMTQRGAFLEAAERSVLEVTGRTPELSTSGGTSDGRFIAPSGAQVVELGVVNATIHQVDECVAVNDVQVLTDIYQQLLQQLLT